MVSQLLHLNLRCSFLNSKNAKTYDVWGFSVPFKTDNTNKKENSTKTALNQIVDSFE